MPPPDESTVVLRTSARYLWAGSPQTHAWPLYVLSLGDLGFSLAPARFARFGFLPILGTLPSFEVAWEEVLRVERTQRGVRFVFRDDRTPVVAASIGRQNRIAEAVALLPVAYDSTLVPSTRKSV